MKYFSQFMLLALAVAVLLGLQYQYWLGENGRFASKQLLTQIEEQQQSNDNQIAANELLRTDVHDLKTGLEAVEEHARLDLGLIKPNETFVQISTAPTTHSSYNP
ncbi:FtsB family cell division protein [Psychrobacter sp. 2Y5]|uniref:FtsB family cell division protein n=1 Tax=unclassified Psychrobacter TaxID=196806 RepID=UPI003F47FD0B